MTGRNDRSVLVAMSGGVDSSVTALLLKEEGYNVVGVTMKLWENDDETNCKFQRCCSPGDIRDARRVADKLGINFYVINMMKEFREEVVKNFVAEYSIGRTPNPCVHCNGRIKFNYLLKKADELGIHYLATGHYARIMKNNNKYNYCILKGVDRRKDQSYFLFNTPRTAIPRLLMPLGEFYKSDVREIARKNSLVVADKPDSQEICFIPHNNYSVFLKKEGVESRRGMIVDTSGRVLGYHEGFFNYTVGQREGLGISTGKRLYVVRLDALTNTVVVGSEEETYSSEFFVKELNWFIPVRESETIECSVKVRYRGNESPCSCVTLSDNRARVVLQTPVRAVTPGQAAVFYHGDLLLGGGWIE